MKRSVAHATERRALHAMCVDDIVGIAASAKDLRVQLRTAACHLQTIEPQEGL